VAHTADAPGLRIAVPPDPDMIFLSAGSHLRDRYGPRYLSVGFTVDHGAAGLGMGGSGPGETVAVTPPAPNWFERPLGDAGIDRFVLDLRGLAPPAARAWLDAPIRARGLADRGPGSVLYGGTAAEWFDVIVHVQVLTPAGPV
jgi:erythromycin esterase-like protein